VLLRSTLIYSPAIVLTRISGLLLVVVATRLIDQTEYGLLTLVVTVGELIDTGLSTWLRIALLRLGGKGEISAGSIWLAGRVLFFSTAAAIVLSAAASAVVVPERWMQFAAAVCSYLIAAAISRFALTILQMQQRHSAYSLLEFLRAVLQFALPVASILIFRNSFLAMSLASSLAVLFAAMATCVVAAQRVVAGPPRFTYREFFALGVPLVLMALVGFGMNSAERVILKIYYDAGAVAVFAASYALARQPIDMVANAINTAAFPELVSRFDEEGPAAAGRFLSQTLALMMRLCLPIAALLVALSEDIVGLVLPPDYRTGVMILFPLIAFSILCNNVNSFVYGGVIHAHKRPWLLIITNSMGSIGTIGLSLLLIPPFSAIGAAMALAGGSLLSLVTCMAVTGRMTAIPVPWRDLAISVLIAVAAGIAAAIASAAVGDAAVIFKLGAGGCAGGIIVLGLNSLFHPETTMALATKLRTRLGIA
jgi:O-antigen/teichoic acid export membrane protein